MKKILIIFTLVMLTQKVFSQTIPINNFIGLWRAADNDGINIMLFIDIQRIGETISVFVIDFVNPGSNGIFIGNIRQNRIEFITFFGSQTSLSFNMNTFLYSFSTGDSIIDIELIRPSVDDIRRLQLLYSY